MDKSQLGITCKCTPSSGLLSLKTKQFKMPISNE